MAVNQLVDEECVKVGESLVMIPKSCAPTVVVLYGLLNQFHFFVLFEIKSLDIIFKK